jgi:hypothetical protein
LRYVGGVSGGATANTSPQAQYFEKLAGMNRSVKKNGPDTRARFNYFVCVDIVVVACILVIAGRPDGLAITVSAVIVAACALVYRCSLGIRTTMTDKSRAPAPIVQDVDRKFSPTTYTEREQGASDRGSKGTSWLREAD